MVKTEKYIPESGKDKGKVFIVSAMSAFEGDRYARKLIKALIDAGSRLPPEAIELGMGGLAGLGMQFYGKMNDGEAQEALSALFSKCKIKRDENSEPETILEEDLQDPMTMVNLRTISFKLNLDFLKAAIFQTSPLLAALIPQTAGEEKESSPSQKI